MFVPLWLLIPGTILAALSLAAIAVGIFFSMRDAGRRLLGPIDLYLDDHVLERRWCVLYLIVHRSIGCHSLASL